MKKYILIPILIITFSSFSQSKSDTIVLNEKDCGVSFEKYMFNLLPIISNKNFSYVTKTKQDSIVFYEDLQDYKYLIFKNKKGDKILEGPLNYGLLEGNIKTFYRNGEIKSSRYYGFNKDKNVIDWIDMPYQIGEWNYYNRKGKITKIEKYLTLLDTKSDDQKFIFYRLKKTIHLTGKKPHNFEQLDIGSISKK
jgi:hypothetical protein